jgi:hypothetical protein
VDLPAVLAAFDEQMRRHPVAGPGVRVEVEERVTRTVGTDASWSAVVWSGLTEAYADEVIAAEVARSTGTLEWKLYSHDRPADLPDRLKAAGLQPEPVETLMVAEIADLDLPVAEPAGVRLVGVDGPQGVESMLGVHEEVFGAGSVHPGTVGAVRTALGLRPRPIEAVVAWAGEVAVSAGRVDSTRAPTSPACGAVGRSRPGAVVGSSERWWATAPSWPVSGASATCRSMRCLRAGPSWSGWASTHSPRRPRGCTRADWIRVWPVARSRGRPR